MDRCSLVKKWQWPWSAREAKANNGEIENALAAYNKRLKYLPMAAMPRRAIRVSFSPIGPSASYAWSDGKQQARVPLKRCDAT